ncbi:hypothetical protein Pyrfu_0733 [Pyrolobus fumarii 1A]|uniref:Uncharacterized protein n=1 Tax=Pyrolobus fumarii (strain DSM 11204 / 1A) TaxID=694429 RepID=G0ED43_PYRF1|nr:hypothetical protein Pyrfu_0733 [Pyrolobus fumarii 1A]
MSKEACSLVFEGARFPLPLKYWDVRRNRWYVEVTR